jgi:hypothetical protein
MAGDPLRLSRTSVALSVSHIGAFDPSKRVKVIPTETEEIGMGWESREWAKWSDEQRDAYLDGRAPRKSVTGAELVERLDSPYSSGVSLRIKVWGGLAAATALLAAVVIYGIATAPSETGRVGAASIWQPQVIYGWQHVPPQGSRYIDPSRIGDTLAGEPIICTAREPDDQGRWVCNEYTPVHAGQQVFVMPADSQLRSVACNTRPAAPCPGTTI